MTRIGVLIYLEIALPLSILFHSSNLERSSTSRNLKLKSLPLQILERIWISLQFLFLALMEAPMQPKILHQHRQVFHRISLKHILRNNFGSEHTPPQLQH